MTLTLKADLPFTCIAITYKNHTVEIPNILIDTGSATTMLSVDSLLPLRIFPEPDDTIHTIRGVGGVEIVFRRTFDSLQAGGGR